MKVNPIAIPDIGCYLLYDYDDIDKENVYSIGSIENDKYIEVKEGNKDAIFSAIKYLNGENTIKEVEEKVISNMNCKINIEELTKILERGGLLLGINDGKVEKGEYDLLSFNLFRLDISKYEKFFNIFEKIIKPTKILIILCTCIALLFCNVFSNIINLNIFNISGNYIVIIISTFVIMGISLFIHEVAHGAVAYKYGLIPKQLVVSLYLYISPIVYLKIPGIYTVAPKVRIKIWSAGVVSNLLLASISIIVYTVMGRLGINNMIGSLLLISFYVNSILIISNLFPLLPLDGYFIMSTLIKIPNLRKQSFVDFKNIILGKKVKFKGIYFVYFLLSAGIMAYIIGSQVFNTYSMFMENFKVSNSVVEALWGVKFYIAVILLFASSKVRRFVTIK